MLYSIHYIRGIAALLVVLFHFREELNNVYPFRTLGDSLFINGYVGVDLFFIISGFVIALSTKSDPSIKGFLLKRFFRIYPLYFLCMLLVIFLWRKEIDVAIIKSFLFIPLDFSKPAPWYGYSVIITAWTLTYEIVFYLIFSISMLVSWKHRVLTCSLFILLLNATLQLLFTHGITLDPYKGIVLPESYPLIAIYIIKTLSSPLIFEFVLGSLLYLILGSGELTKKVNSTFVKFAFYCSIVGMVAFYISSSDGAHGVLNAGLYSFFVILLAITYEQKFKLGYSRILFWFGNISYSLYLIHPVVIKSFAGRFITFPLYQSSHGIVNFIFLTIVSLLIATLLYYLVEKPSMHYARKLHIANT
ncbi:acyltransferase [Escherichia coli]|uniref:acyltransferase family protein n=1 Tax=Escherichia coli TaxID=562 RepID=UPI001E2E5ECF|nr:acyltransferase [Escherichia coli]MCD9249002.1 acyltransferase [Escherichia coli]